MSTSKKNPSKPFGEFTINGHQLPGVWQYMFPEEFSYMHLPIERVVDCNRCNMVHTDGYASDMKCCSYFPQIPNYMLGLALKDPDTRERVEQVIENGHALPEGTVQTQGALQIAAEEYVDDQFGKSRRLRCPFLKDEGGCGLYSYRGVVCATFFCHNDHGDVGFRYWEDLQNLVRQAEVALQQCAMSEVGIDSTIYNNQLDAMVDKIDQMTDPQTGGAAEWVRRQLFGDFFGNEKAFFEACADFVIENKDRLYELITAKETTMAFKYEKAVEAGLSPAQLKEIQCLPETMGDVVPVGALWYKAQLATRRLWEIPFNESAVVLNPNATVSKNPGQDALSQFHGAYPMMVTVAGRDEDVASKRYFLLPEEVSLLEVFKEPQVIGEAVFERPELANFSRSRDFLAECLRKSILVTADSTASPEQ